MEPSDLVIVPTVPVTPGPAAGRPVTGGQYCAHVPEQFDLVGVSGANQYRVKPLPLAITVVPSACAVFSTAPADGPVVGPAPVGPPAPATATPSSTNATTDTAPAAARAPGAPAFSQVPTGPPSARRRDGPSDGRDQSASCRQHREAERERHDDLEQEQSADGRDRLVAGHVEVQVDRRDRDEEPAAR